MPLQFSRFKAINYNSMNSRRSGLLMHVKCMHELCSLLPHIPTYLHHIVLITNVLNDFGDFLNNPLSSGFNCVWQKTPSVNIFDFTGATGLGTEQTQSPHFGIFKTEGMELLKEAKGAGKTKRGPVARPPPRACHQVSFAPPSSGSLQCFTHRLVLT